MGEEIFLQRQREKSGINKHCSSGRQLKMKEQIKIKHFYVQEEGREYGVGLEHLPHNLRY